MIVLFLLAVVSTVHIVADDSVLCDSTTQVCYKFYTDTAKRWSPAQAVCNDNGGRLAVINSIKLHRKIRRHINNHPALKAVIHNGYWIGANDIDTEGEFVFADTTPTLSLTYDKGWDSTRKGKRIMTQPNNNVQQNKGGQDCVQLWKNPKKKPKWNMDDDYCFTRKSFICEYSNCPSAPDFLDFGTSQYWFSPSNITSDFNGSRDYCRSICADLAVPNTELENEFLYNNTLAVQGPGQRYPYLGCQELGAEGTWTCVDGTELTFLKWHPGEPNGEETENCFAFQLDAAARTADYSWVDLSCVGYTEQFSCERPL